MLRVEGFFFFFFFLGFYGVSIGFFIGVFIGFAGFTGFRGLERFMGFRVYGLGSPVVPFCSFLGFKAFESNQPKKGTLSMIWLLGYQVGFVRVTGVIGLKGFLGGLKGLVSGP